MRTRAAVWWETGWKKGEELAAENLYKRDSYGESERILPHRVPLVFFRFLRVSSRALFLARARAPAARLRAYIRAIPLLHQVRKFSRTRLLIDWFFASREVWGTGKWVVRYIMVIITSTERSIREQLKGWFVSFRAYVYSLPKGFCCRVLKNYFDAYEYDFREIESVVFSTFRY